VAVLDERLARHLEEELVRAVRAELDPEELEFFAQVDPPRVEAVEADGMPAVMVTFYGSVTTTEWDGTEADATEIVLSAVGAAAASISDGYWRAGGWKTRTSSPPS
jgi:hypothetical protein